MSVKLVIVDLLLTVIRYCSLGTHLESKTLLKVSSTNNFKDLFTQPAFTCSKLTIETAEQVVKYVQNYFTPCSSVSVVNFEHVIAGWVGPCQTLL